MIAWHNVPYKSQLQPDFEKVSVTLLLLLLEFSILQCRGFHIKLTFLSPGHFRNSVELNNSTKQQHSAQLPAAPSVSVLDFCFALQSVSKQNQSEWIENYFNLVSISFISEETARRSGSQKSKSRKFFDVYIWNLT